MARQIRGGRREVDARRALGKRGQDQHLLPGVERGEDGAEVRIGARCFLQLLGERCEARGDATARLVELLLEARTPFLERGRRTTRRFVRLPWKMDGPLSIIVVE